MDLLEEIKNLGPIKFDGPWYERPLDSHAFSKRDSFCKNYAWAAPDEDALKEIKGFVGNDKILEIGSGLGLWARLLYDMGVKITPTNPKRADNHYLNLNKEPFIEIHAMAHKEALKAFGDGHDVLMLCWPPYSDSMASEALKAFKGDKLVYIGEGGSGCTADDEFFTLLEKKWVEAKVINIPQWWGIHDNLFLYKRKKKEVKVPQRLIQFD